MSEDKPAARRPSLHFESMTEKLAAVRALNDLLRAAGKPAVHEGLDQASPEFNIYLCIIETPIDQEAA